MKRVKNFKLLYILCMLSVLAFCQTGCKKFIEVDAPATSINASNVFTTDGGAIQVVTGFYTKLANDSYSFTSPGMTYFSLGLYADELTLYYKNDLFISNLYLNNLQAPDGEIWTNLYTSVAYANDAIEGLEHSSGLTPAIKDQLIGESKFMRAFLYFYLVNEFGAIPLPLNTDAESNRLLARTQVTSVYTQIITDLLDAKRKLNVNYLDATLLKPTNEKVRPTKATATALLARVYLYKGDYVRAEEQATELIESKQFSLTPLDEVFIKNSNEAIWSLQPTRASSGYGYNTSSGRYFVLPTTGPSSTNFDFPVYMSDALLNSFEKNDARRKSWVDSVVTMTGSKYIYPAKYKAGRNQISVTEYDVVFRLGEQYLIRAEARARRGNKDGAVDDLNTIRDRASTKAPGTGASLLPALTNALTDLQLFKAIEHERRIELFTEWGHRWFDIKRTPGFLDVTKTRAEELMPDITATKGGIWNNRAILFPIPQADRDKDPKLTQNDGY